MAAKPRMKAAERRRLRDRMRMTTARCPSCRYRSWILVKGQVLCSVCGRVTDPEFLTR